MPNGSLQCVDTRRRTDTAVGGGGVIIQRSGPGRNSSLFPVPAGSSATFGRSGPEDPVDVLIDHDGVSRRAGEISAGLHYWKTTNYSSSSTYVVENVENAGEYVRVPPLRCQVPIPFELSRVILLAGNETVEFQVFAPTPVFLDPLSARDHRQDRTRRAFPLDETAKYFLVLVALAEPRLRGSAVGIPSTEQIAARLRPLPGYADLSARAVAFHLDYLMRAKFRLRAPVPGTGEPRQEPWGFAVRREELVTFAVRFGLVGEEHLALLPAHRR
jgi:hypothetical protein